MGRGAAWSWKELQEPRVRCHHQCRGRVLGKEKRLAGWPSILGPLRHPEKSEIIEEEQEEEEKGWQGDPQESPKGPWSSDNSFTCRLCFLGQATYPLCASDSNSLLCCCSEGSLDFMPVKRLV